MNQLSKLQNTFQENVLNPDTQATIDWVSAEGRAEPKVQLSIYSYAYKARLKEVLENDYPATLMAIGDEYFEQLSEQYIETHPSQYFSLRDFGSHLPDFLLSLTQQKKQTSIPWQDMPWLYELATFEWDLGQTFDAADAILFTEQEMSTIAADAWPELTFNFHPSVQVLNFDWNTVEMWQALTKDEPTEITAINTNKNSWLIWREELTTRFRSIQDDEKIALEMLIKGGDFTDICEELSNLMDENEVATHIASLLKGWIVQGLISEVILH